MLNASSYADKWSDYIRAGSDSCSPQLLAELAHSEVDRIRIRVAENPATPLETLEILAADKNADVRIAVGTNPRTPEHIRYGLAFEEDPNVRLGLAEDINTPPGLLEKLAQDTNPYVSCRAAQTMEYLATQAQKNSSCGHSFFRWANFGFGMDQPALKYA